MDVTKGRVWNGYGIQTSKLSVTNIGQYNLEAEAITIREESQREALRMSASHQLSKNKSFHPSALNLHMQKEYPTTIALLQDGGKHRPPTPQHLKAPAMIPLHSRQQMPPPRLPPDCPPEVSQRTAQISDWGARKREENKLQSSNAVVGEILRGEPPRPDPVGALTKPRKAADLFPAKATHQQLLGIDGKLVGKHPDEVAPPVNHGYKWLGAAKGWEGNRGLPAAREEFKDGRIDKWPSVEGAISRNRTRGGNH